ncbi:Bug family tripartite tricarboxylate transporter substrate binding protein [Modicisalibacter radicis]|uniref:Bug family tripartite tricarboxylate transporter substrate binding protein n=1 Tax=Halomonas sp. EAR18 TaxID=2518972 RepID=UPI00109CBDF6|nr:tripartite tricarboxylate transporter substrate binding protein [Halomonas sp. EAR18]
MKLTASITFALLSALAVPPAIAQDYPDHPIKVIVPHGAGGSTDITTRLVSEPLSEELGQGVAIANITGGGTAIGAQEVARSRPDGYTLASTHEALLTSSAMGVNTMGPDSLTPIAQLGLERQIIAVPDDSPMHDLQDFYDAAAPGGEKPKLGVSPGAANHFAFMRILEPIDDPEVTFVPTGGGGPSMKALLTGTIDVGTFVVSEAKDQIAADNIRVLATFGPQRHKDLPDVQTSGEQGYPMDIGIHYVWYAPKDTPEARIDTLADALETVIGDEGFRQRMLDRSIEPAFARGEALQQALDERWQTMQAIAKGLNQ